MELEKIFVSSDMTQFLETSFVQLTALSLGSCMVLVGALLMIRQYTQGIFLSFAMLALGLALIADFFDAAPLGRVALLIVWPAFFLYVRQGYQPVRLRITMILHFLVPLAWGLVQFGGGMAFVNWYESVAFLQWIPYAVFSLVALYEQLHSSIMKQALQPSFLQWSFGGLVILCIVRLMLPFLPFPNQFFIAVTGLYFMGIFSFSIHGPFRRYQWSPVIEKEVGTNYDEELKRRLDVLLNQEKVFVIPDLTLQELSQRMCIRTGALSFFLSTSLGSNFNEVMNTHRVQEVKRLMHDPETDPKATLMELAYQAGFNSKATFNRSFKEITGMTPKAYKLQAIGSD